LKPPSWKAAKPNPPSSNPPPDKGKEKPIEGMEGSNTKNSFKKKRFYIEKVKEQTLQPSMFEEPAATGSPWDIGSDDDDPNIYREEEPISIF
tara:strand:- start:396 stop:671 length:276 start_codon:yes stop_codon:yes gene_type:complete